MALPTFISGGWTLQCAGVEQSSADWGLSKPNLRRRSLHVSEFTADAEGQAFDSAALFAFGAQVIVRRDRTGSGTAYTGGTIYFQGYCSKHRRTGKPDGESVTYTFSDLWWLFQRTVFTQLWTTDFGKPISHVILNLKPGTTGNIVSVPDQIYSTILDGSPSSIGICNCVLASFPGAFAVDVSLLPAYFPTFDEKKDVTCADAIRSQARWVPGMVSWVDYAQTPPVIHFACRFGTSLQVSQFPAGWPPTQPTPGTLAVQMPLVSAQVGDGVEVVGGDITPLNELLVAQVAVNYETTKSINGQNFTGFTQDLWPATPTANGGIVMTATVGLQISSARVQSATLSTRLLSNGPLSGNLNWWLEKNPQLRDYPLGSVSPGTLKINNISFTDTFGNVITSPLPYELLNEGALHPWMQVGGQQGIQREIVVHGYAYYDDAITGETGKTAEPLKHTVKTTNLPSATYTNVTTQYGTLPSIPFGMAYTLYSLLSVLQWEGELQVTRSDGEVDDRQFLGCLLNLTGGATAWQTMAALIQETEEDLEGGVVTVKFGANKFLDPGQIIDLLRATRSRSFTEWTSSFGLGGGAPVSEIDMLNSTAKQDSVKGTGLKNVRITGGQDPVGNTNPGYKLVEDATTGQVTLYQLNPDGTSLTTAILPPLFSAAGAPGPTTLT